MAISALLAPTPVLMAPIAAPSLAIRIADLLTDAVASGAVEPGERWSRPNRREAGRQPRALARGAEAPGGARHRRGRRPSRCTGRALRRCPHRPHLRDACGIGAPGLGTAVPRYVEEPALLGTLDQLIEAMRTCQRRRDSWMPARPISPSTRRWSPIQETTSWPSSGRRSPAMC